MSVERFTIDSSNRGEVLKAAADARADEQRAAVRPADLVQIRTGWSGSSVAGQGVTEHSVQRHQAVTPVEFILDGKDVVELPDGTVTERAAAINGGLITKDGKLTESALELFRQGKPDGEANAEKAGEKTDTAKAYEAFDAKFDELEAEGKLGALVDEVLDDQNMENVPEEIVTGYQARAAEMLSDHSVPISDFSAEGPMSGFLDDSQKQAALTALMQGDKARFAGIAKTAMDNAMSFGMSAEFQQLAADAGIGIEGDVLVIEGQRVTMYDAFASGLLSLEDE